mmetsp:Transcript_83617/g.210749  ORF Transcript_83617/g.210749 Transcript_83617/m.210749 type:complete len:207 (+) Transcript_83617:279-899(+)
MPQQPYQRRAASCSSEAQGSVARQVRLARISSTDQQTLHNLKQFGGCFHLRLLLRRLLLRELQALLNGRVWQGPGNKLRACLGLLVAVLSVRKFIWLCTQQGQHRTSIGILLIRIRSMCQEQTCDFGGEKLALCCPTQGQTENVVIEMSCGRLRISLENPLHLLCGAPRKCHHQRRWRGGAWCRGWAETVSGAGWLLHTSPCPWHL